MLTKFIILVQFTHILALINSFNCINNGNFDSSTWPLAFSSANPLQIHNTFEWFCMWFIQYNISLAYAIATSLTSSYFVCCCLYIIAICDHFNLLVHSIQPNIASNRPNSTGTRTHLETEAKFKRVIEVHAEIIEYM